MTTESKQLQWIGPCTKASPNGFLFSPETVKQLVHGTSLLLMVKAVVRDLKRLHKELRETPGMWVPSTDYGAYEHSVRPLFRTEKLH